MQSVGLYRLFEGLWENQGFNVPAEQLQVQGNRILIEPLNL